MMFVPPWVESDVSRETIADLKLFETLLIKWNPKINLVSKSSMEHIWDRHIWDSVQISELVEFPSSWVDLGSGGGFPGIILAILMKHRNAPTEMTVVESDNRKCAFLRAAIRDLGLEATVLSERVENLPPMNAKIVSARALADLDLLLSYAEPHLAQGGICVFPKGQTWEKEVEAASQNWSFRHQAHNSKTNTGSAILTIEDIKRV